MTLAAAASRLEDLLVDRLRVWARTNWPAEDVAAFGLVFTIGGLPLPGPGLAIASLLETWLAEPDEYGVGLIAFNPAEYERFDEGFLDELPEDAEAVADKLMNTWLEAEDDDTWIDFMGRVAARLAAEDWSDLPRSDDFVIYASTAEVESQTELEAHLRRSVPAATLTRLRERGLLHVADDA